MKDKLRLYIEENLSINTFKRARCAKLDLMEELAIGSSYSSIDNYIDDNKDDNKFQKLLFSYIDDKGLKDSDVYNKVNIDRRLFSKIRNDNYHPGKDTIIKLGIALNLDINELEGLLSSASYSLPKNNERDLIIRFSFINKIYNIDTINDFLYDYNVNILD
ncbi:MAG: XRE family transcriptional regulator [Bacilli bacterium]|nr:XRE family transcriptional regulator [Bacilli bacterium]